MAIRAGCLNVLPQNNIDYVHDKCHKGQVFRATHYFNDVTNGEIKRYLVATGEKEVHVFYDLAVEGPVIFQFSENPVVTTSATAISGFNLNRCCSNLPSVKLYHSGTFSSTGTVLQKRYVCGATGGGAGVIRTFLGLSSVRPETEIILDTASLYLVQITNTANSNQSFSMNIDFYEER